MFRNKKLEQNCCIQKKAVRKWGPKNGNIVLRRMAQLRAAESLEAIRYLPQARCHELKADRKGQLSVDIEQPMRIVFECANSPIPKKGDGGLDWKCVTAIRVLEVTDPHGKKRR